MKSRIPSVIRALPKTALAVALSALVAAPNTAKAAFFHIDDTSSAEVITITVNDFEAGGFFLNGSLIQAGTHNEVTRTFAETDIPFTFAGSWIDNGQTQPRSGTIWFTEEGNPNVLSDILTFTYSSSGGAGHLEGSFVSFTTDDHLVGVVPVGVTLWSEDNGQFDFSNSFIEAHANSTPVPEPSTYLAGGLLLLPLAFGAMRRMRKSRTA